MNTFDGYNNGYNNHDFACHLLSVIAYVRNAIVLNLKAVEEI